METTIGASGQRLSLSPLTTPWAWSGAAEWIVDDGAAQPWRIGRTLALTTASPEFAAAAQEPAGVHARVMTDARAVELTVRRPGGAGGVCDIVVDGSLVRRWVAGEGVTSIVHELPGEGHGQVEVWLPHQGQAALVDLVLHEYSSARPASEPALSWITYGSSITQCAAAPGPAETWPALVARDRGWQLTSLGFGGQCHLDAAVARSIRGTPAELISLCLGVNVYGRASFNARSLASAVAGFVQTIRDGHPSTPILVISPISSPLREKEANLAGMTLDQVRSSVHRAVDVLTDLGDERLHVVDGREVLGEGDAGLLFDGLHPGPAGYRLMATRLAPLLGSVLGSG